MQCNAASARQNTQCPPGMAFQASTSRPHIPKTIAPLSVQQAPGAAETAKKLEEDARREKAEREAREAEYALASPRAGGGAAAGKQFCMHCGYPQGAGSRPKLRHPCRWRRWRRAATRRRRR